MKKLTFLISHIPDPRFVKRIKVSKDVCETSVIYWDRGNSLVHDFKQEPDVSYRKINISMNLRGIVNRVFSYMKFFRRAIKELKILNPNVIHVGNLDMLLITILYKLLFNKDAHIVYEVADLHKIIYNNSNNIVKKIIKKCLVFSESLMCKHINYLLLTSPYFWRDYYSDFVPKEKYLFIPNVPERRIFDDTSTISTRKDEVLTVGFIGMIRYKKQLEMLIEAVQDLPINVLIAGTGPDYQDIKKKCESNKKVTMIGAYNYEEEIVSLYSKIDCVYAVYDTNLLNVRVALPNRLYEAIVCEKPIIVASGTKLGEFVLENDIGYVVSDKDNSELKSLFELISNNNALLDEKKNRCKLVKNNYYMENYEVGLRQIYLK